MTRRHDESSPDIRAARHLLQKKMGFDTAIDLSPEYQEQLEKYEVQLSRTPRGEDMNVGRGRVSADAIEALQERGTSWVVVSEVLARADAGLRTSVQEIHDMDKVVASVHNNQGVGIQRNAPPAGGGTYIQRNNAPPAGVIIETPPPAPVIIEVDGPHRPHLPPPPKLPKPPHVKIKIGL